MNETVNDVYEDIRIARATMKAIEEKYFDINVESKELEKLTDFQYALYGVMNILDTAKERLDEIL